MEEERNRKKLLKQQRHAQKPLMQQENKHHPDLDNQHQRHLQEPYNVLGYSMERFINSKSEISSNHDVEGRRDGHPYPTSGSSPYCLTQANINKIVINTFDPRSEGLPTRGVSGSSESDDDSDLTELMIGHDDEAYACESGVGLGDVVLHSVTKQKSAAPTADSAVSVSANGGGARSRGSNALPDRNMASGRESANSFASAVSTSFDHDMEGRLIEHEKEVEYNGKIIDTVEGRAKLDMQPPLPRPTHGGHLGTTNTKKKKRQQVDATRSDQTGARNGTEEKVGVPLMVDDFDFDKYAPGAPPSSRTSPSKPSTPVGQPGVCPPPQYGQYPPLNVMVANHQPHKTQNMDDLRQHYPPSHHMHYHHLPPYHSEYPVGPHYHSYGPPQQSPYGLPPYGTTNMDPMPYGANLSSYPPNFVTSCPELKSRKQYFECDAGANADMNELHPLIPRSAITSLCTPVMIQHQQDFEHRPHNAIDSVFSSVRSVSTKDLEEDLNDSELYLRSNALSRGEKLAPCTFVSFPTATFIITCSHYCILSWTGLRFF